MRAILLDRPEVVAGAGPTLAAAGVADRVQVVGGDFFAAVPAGGDAYALGAVLYDWDDDQCVTILDNCRRAMGEGGRLLIAEIVIPPGDGPTTGRCWTSTSWWSSAAAPARRTSTGGCWRRRGCA